MARQGIAAGERIRRRVRGLRCPRRAGHKARREVGSAGLFCPRAPGAAPGPRLRSPEEAAAENPLSKNNLPEGWTAPEKPEELIDPRSVGSPALIAGMLTACGHVGLTQGPRFVAFFGCMYYAMMRPSEVAALTRIGCRLPREGWGNLTFADSSPRPGRRSPTTAWSTSTAASRAAPEAEQERASRPAGRSAGSPYHPNSSPCCASTSSASASDPSELPLQPRAAAGGYPPAPPPATQMHPPAPALSPFLDTRLPVTPAGRDCVSHGADLDQFDNDASAARSVWEGTESELLRAGSTSLGADMSAVGSGAINAMVAWRRETISAQSSPKVARSCGNDSSSLR